MIKGMEINNWNVKKYSMRNMEKALTCSGCRLLLSGEWKKMLTFTFEIDRMFLQWLHFILKFKFNVLNNVCILVTVALRTQCTRTVYVVICEKQKTCVWLQLFNSFWSTVLFSFFPRFYDQPKMFFVLFYTFSNTFFLAITVRINTFVKWGSMES